MECPTASTLLKRLTDDVLYCIDVSKRVRVDLITRVRLDQAQTFVSCMGKTIWFNRCRARGAWAFKR